MAQPPSRPFESLAWYRDAARNGFRDEQPEKPFLAWLQGFGLLQAHISLYALGIVALYSLNLVRDPSDSWAERWILAWTVLVLIHAVVVGLLWALKQWNADEPDEPLLMMRRPMGPAWAMPPAEQANAREASFRVNEPGQDPVEAAPWSDWNGEMPGPEIPESERASWSEAAAAAWLDRTGQLTSPAETTDETSKSE
jgi:hypothetical protein